MRPSVYCSVVRVASLALLLAFLAPRAAALPDGDPVQCNPVPGAAGCGEHSWRYSLTCLPVPAADEPQPGLPGPFPLLWDGCYPGGFPRVSARLDGGAICLSPREDCAWVAAHAARDLFVASLVFALRYPEFAGLAGWQPECVPGACLMLAVRVANGTVTGLAVKHLVGF